MSRRLWWSACALVVVLALTAVRVGSRRQARENREPVVDTPVDSPQSSTSLDEVANADRQQIAASRAPEGEALPVCAIPEPVARRVSGRVLDTSGNPRSGLGVGLAGSSFALVFSDAGGFFELPPEGTREGLLVVLDTDWATVRGSEVAPSSPDIEHLVIVAPSIDVDGHVVDDAMRGVAGARIVVELANEALAGFPQPLDSTTLVPIVAETNSDGYFEFRGLAGLEGTLLGVRHPDHPPVRVSIPARDCPGLLIQLGAVRASAPHLLGTVFYPGGEPAAGAQVMLGGDSTRTSADGRFALEPKRVHSGADLIAIARGFQPAILSGYSEVVAAAGGLPPPVRIVLGPPTLRISGKVLRSGGVPVPGLRVAIVDGTEWLSGSMPPTWVESLAAVGDAEPRTDADGSFVLEGLQERLYRVQAWSPETLELVRSAPVHAGTQGLVLTLPEDPHRAQVRGHVVDPAGNPCPGVRVAANVVYVETARGSDWLEGPSAVTGADGSFELLRVPRAAVRLDVTGIDVMPTSRVLDDADSSEDLEIVALPRCRFRVECRNGETLLPDGLQAFGADGARVPLFTFASNQWSSSSYVPLSEGDSPVLCQAAGRYVLVFLRSGKEQARLTVDLFPDPDRGVITVEYPAD